MDVGSVANGQIDIQTLLANISGGKNNANANNLKNETGYYAKKGEPMYMEEMDEDEDGVVTLDEFREYCKNNNISTRSMIKMSQSAATYRIMQAEEESIDYISKLIPNISPKVKQSDSAYKKQTENQYNISNNTNDKKVSYREYMEYCEQNSVQNGFKANAKVEDSDDGVLKISNRGKALKLYKDSEDDSVKNTFERAV